MPKVGNKKFGRTRAGQDAARKYSRKTKQPIVYSYNEGGNINYMQPGLATPANPYTSTAVQTGQQTGGMALAGGTDVSVASPYTDSYGGPYHGQYGWEKRPMFGQLGGQGEEEEEDNWSLRKYQDRLSSNYSKGGKYKEGGEYEEGGKAEGPKYPHDMYNTATGEKFVAENEEDHNKMDKLGYKHLDELSDDEKKMVMQKENKMAMGGKYEQFKKYMGLD